MTNPVRTWRYEEDDFEFFISDPALETRATCRHCGEVGLSAILANDAAEGHAMLLVIHTDDCALLMAANQAARSARK